MRNVAIAAVLALALTACATGTPPEARLAAACRAYAATLSTLAAAKPELSADQIEAVDKAVAVAGPTCREGETVTDIPTALIAVSGALRNLAIVEGESR